jgi:tripeptide aminopeptidase
MKAPMIDSNELQRLFLHLAGINGVSLHERRVADEVKILLHPMNVRIVEDDAGKSIGGNCGNILCFPPDFRNDEPAIMLAAHLDTVSPTENLKPCIHHDRITSDGTTILGADNRMGLSILTYLLQSVVSRNLPHRNFFVAHSVAEEVGVCGAEKFDASPYNISCAYVFDSSRRPGIYVRECVGLYEFNAIFHGKASHAGVAPEEGVNAIAMASKAISAVRIGRIDAELTANIGTISGGRATNVVPDKVFVEGEVRSFSPKRILEQLQSIESTFRQSCESGGSLDFNYKINFEPYILDPKDQFLQDLEQAIRSVGLTPQPIRYTGGSDANTYNAKGIPAVNIGIGAQKPHTNEEFILLEDLTKSAELAFSLIKPRN